MTTTLTREYLFSRNGFAERVRLLLLYRGPGHPRRPRTRRVYGRLEQAKRAVGFEARETLSPGLFASATPATFRASLPFKPRCTMTKPSSTNPRKASSPVDAGPDAPLPIFLKLAGRKVVVVGAGKIAAAKVQALLASGARVSVIAPEIHPEVERAPVSIERRRFAPSDLDGAWLAIAAATAEVNRQVAEAAEARRIFVNAVDDPKSASAYAAGVVRRGGVTLAISTAGQAPALAGLLREALERVLPEELERWVEIARRIRADWKRRGVPIAERRPLLLEALNRAYPRQELAP